MLLRFGVANHLSLRTYQELLFTASPRSASNTIAIAPGTDRKIIPVTAIYGANASGKSNVLAALWMFRSHVRNSHTEGKVDSKIPRSPFQLSADGQNEPTKFDCDVAIDGIRYHYGYTFSDDRFIEEWLYAYPSNKRQVWFHRNEESPNKYHFGKFLTGRNKVIQDLTRANSLFLSCAAQNNHDQLTKIYSYFRRNWAFLGDDHADGISAAKIMQNDADKQRLLSFLKFADIGITNASLEELKVPDEMREMSQALKDLFKKYIKDQEVTVDPDLDTGKTLKLGHSGDEGACIYLSLDSESRGTRRLMSLAQPIFRALERGHVVIIDELDASLHTLLAKKIVEVFASPETNRNGAQLIFTTHDTNLLSVDVMSREGIWFTEKDRSGSTHLYPLSDIKVRAKDNIERGYLRGRFGAIPFLGPLDELLEDTSV